MSYALTGPYRIICIVNWTCSTNYPSNNILFVLSMFAYHENIGKKPKFMILLFMVQKLWLFVIYPNMVIWPYLSITFETVHSRIINFGFLPMFSWSANTLKTRQKNIGRIVWAAINLTILTYNKVYINWP